METPTLSTMVVIYQTNLKFDTTLLAERLPLNNDIIRIEKKGVVKKGESSKDHIKHRNKKEAENTNNTGFGHNSITIVMLNDAEGRLPQKEITVKIFKNGVFHLTGVLDPKYDESVISILLKVVKQYYVEKLEDPIDDIMILNRRVVLMNYTTHLIPIQTVPREALHMAIRNSKLDNVTSYYDPDVYPAVKIHVGTGILKANVFRTGKIILTGIRSNEECEQLTSLLLSLFEKVLPQKQKQEHK